MLLARSSCILCVYKCCPKCPYRTIFICMCPLTSPHVYSHIRFCSGARFLQLLTRTRIGIIDIASPPHRASSTTVGNAGHVYSAERTTLRGGAVSGGAGDLQRVVIVVDLCAPDNMGEHGTLRAASAAESGHDRVRLPSAAELPEHSTLDNKLSTSEATVS